MPDWLLNSVGNGNDLRLDLLTYRLVVAALLGGVVAGVYWISHRRDETLAWSFVATLVLLSILIAMVTQVIGDNVARAFSLVGALSIVRFRTVVEDTRDTAFVIFAVIVGMAVGSDYLAVALVGIPVVTVAALLLRSRKPVNNVATATWTLIIRLGVGRSPEEALGPLLQQHFTDLHLLSTATSRQGAAIDLSYRVKLRSTSSVPSIVAELNRLEGVQSVEMRGA